MTSAGIDVKEGATRKGVDAVRVNAPLEELADTLGRKQLTDKEIGDYLSANWHKPVILLALVLVGIWIYQAVSANREKVLGDGAERYSSAQDLFRSAILGIEATDESGKPKVVDSAADKTKAFQDSLLSLTSGYSSSTYAEFAKLYLAASDLMQGRSGDAKTRLRELGIDQVLERGDGKAKKLTRTELVTELGALLYARALLQEKSPEAREVLTKLAKRASIVPGEAVVGLLRTATTKEERDSARRSAEELLQRRPELRRILSREVEGFGVETK